MSGLDLDMLRVLYSRCQPDKALQPGDPRFVDLDKQPADGSSPPRGARWTEMLRRKVKRAGENAQCLLFSGLRGSGKSTELSRFVQSLRDDGYLVAFVDADERIDLFSPLNATDILLAMLFEAERQVLLAEERDPTRVARASVFTRVWDWMSSTDVNLKTLEAGGKVGAPGGPEVNAKVVLELKTRTPLRDRIREVVEHHPTAFLQQIREAFDALRQRASATGHQALVVVVDSLEHLQGTSDQWKDVIASAELLFNGPMIRLPVHTLYTVPPAVVLRLKEPVTFIPMVKLRTRDGKTRHAPGYAALAELITLRIARKHLATLFGEANVEARVEALISASGGYPRALVGLLLDVLTIAEEDTTPAVSPKEFHRVLTRAGDATRQLVKSDGEAAIALLKRVAETKELVTNTDAERWLAARLLDANILLKYLNDEDWWDVHPWVRELDGIASATPLAT